ncbi:MAG: hydrogenase maturation protease [Coriobacteriaceae bacterium]
MEASERTAAVFFVGNRLMLDDGVGPAAYDEILAGYDIPENVTLVDVGCMSLDMLPYVERCDLILTVDAVDGTGDAPGTVYRFEPDAMARHSGPEASLHDLKLVDLFDAASLMGYEAGAAWACRWAIPPGQFVVGSPPNAAALPCWWKPSWRAAPPRLPLAEEIEGATRSPYGVRSATIRHEVEGYPTGLGWHRSPTMQFAQWGCGRGRTRGRNAPTGG